MEHHGEEYYQEGKAIRNRISVFMASVEKAHRRDEVVTVLAQVHAQVSSTLALGKRKCKLALKEPDLFS